MSKGTGAAEGEEPKAESPAAEGQAEDEQKPSEEDGQQKEEDGEEKPATPAAEGGGEYLSCVHQNVEGWEREMGQSKLCHNHFTGTIMFVQKVLNI